MRIRTRSRCPAPIRRRGADDHAVPGAGPGGQPQRAGAGRRDPQRTVTDAWAPLGRPAVSRDRHDLVPGAGADGGHQGGRGVVVARVGVVGRGRHRGAVRDRHVLVERRSGPTPDALEIERDRDVDPGGVEQPEVAVDRLRLVAERVDARRQVVGADHDPCSRRGRSRAGRCHPAAAMVPDHVPEVQRVPVLGRRGRQRAVAELPHAQRRLGGLGVLDREPPAARHWLLTRRGGRHR